MGLDSVDGAATVYFRPADRALELQPMPNGLPRCFVSTEFALRAA